MRWPSTALAVLTVALLLVALVSVARRNLAVAGLSFLAASLSIYFRETRG